MIHGVPRPYPSTINHKFYIPRSFANGKKLVLMYPRIYQKQYTHKTLIFYLSINIGASYFKCIVMFTYTAQFKILN